MILFGSVFVLISMVLTVLAWRGRTIERGEFCRACSFNLAGSPMDNTDDKCPECGQSIYAHQSRRNTIKKKSRLGLAVAITLLVSSIGIIWLNTTGKSNVLFGLLPDSTLLWLCEQGVDEAIDELAIRIASLTNPIPAEIHTRAIELSLAHQADTSQTWNPRWGEVLSLSFGNPVMTDEQMKQYVRNGTEIKAEIRDRVHEGAESVDVILTTSPSRISARTFNNTGYWIQQRLVEGGVVGEKPGKFSGEDQITYNFMVPTREGSTEIPHKSTITPSGSGFDQAPGTEVPVYVKYELFIKGLGVVGECRTEQAVLILDQDTEIVTTFTDLAMAQELCDSIMISPVRVLKNIDKTTTNFGMRVLEMRLKCERIPASIALQPYLRLDDGEEIKLSNTWMKQAPRSTESGTSATWWLNPYDVEMYNRMDRVTKRIIEQGHVDIMFRTEPELAETVPGVDRVLDITLEYMRVPVEAYDDEEKVRFVPVSKTLNELEWIKNSCSRDHSGD